MAWADRLWEGTFGAYSDLTLWSGALGLHIIVYWFLSLLYAILDLTQSPKALMPYRTQPTRKGRLPPATLWKIVRTVAFNQLVVGEAPDPTSGLTQ
jgi:hypothetical protein